MLKKILYGIVGLVALLFIGSFFLPTTTNTSVTKQLKASPEQVVYQFNNIKDWDKWSFWNKMDPSIVMTFGEKTFGKGASYSWDGEKSGSGSLEIIESSPEGTRSKMQFEGFDLPAYADVKVKPAEDGGSIVTWALESEMVRKSPLKRFENAFIQFFNKKAFNKGLEAMDEFIAANPEMHKKENGNIQIPITEVDMPTFQGIVAYEDGKMDEFGSSTYEKGYAAAGEALAKSGLEMDGMPFAYWMDWDSSKNYFKLALGLPVKSGGETFGGKRSIKASYFGPYEGMNVAYEALMAYGADKGYELGQPMEIFMNDPTTVDDPSKIHTDVYFPIE